MWVALIGLCAYASGTEYFELMSKVNEELPHPPPRWAAKWITACSVFLCVILHVSGGRSLPVTMAMVAAFSCAVAALISNEESHFIEFTTTLFGLFYCGFLPSFWIKLRAMSGIPLAIDRAGLCAYASGTEYFELMSKVNEELPHPPPRWAAKWITACSVFLCVILHVSGGRSLPVTMAMVAAFSCAVAALISNEESHFIEFTTTLFGLFYCGFLPSFWIKLRAMSGIPLAIDRAGSIVSSWPLQLGGPTSWTLGVSITLMTVLCVVSADVGAYFSGKNFGKKFFGKKLTTISPNKTIEGAIGGGIFSIACSGICWYLLGIPEELWRTLIIGGFIYASSVFGDLLQSVMKRNAGVKDSGKFIPGHGGFLDRFDSYMFTGSVTYYLTLALIVGLNIRPKYFGA